MPLALVGIDVGTTHVKGVLTDVAGRVLAHATERHGVMSPRPTWAEHDMERDWWGHTVLVIRQLLSGQAGSAQVAAICVSGLWPTVAMTNDSGVPLRNAILTTDTRASSLSIEDFGLVPWDHRGVCTDIWPRLLWVKENEPEVYRQARKMFYSYNYIVYRLSGAYFLDESDACWLSPIFSAVEGRWDRQVTEALGLGLVALPELCHSGQVVGHVTSEASRATGLSKRTRVVIGAGDSYLSLMASGAKHAGDSMLYYGSAGLWIGCNEPASAFLGKCALMGKPTDAYFVGVYSAMTGALLDWYADRWATPRLSEISRADGGIFQRLDAEAARVTSGSSGIIVLPYLAGERSPRVNPAARGVLFGLNANHTGSHIYRALMESFGYVVRHTLEGLVSHGWVLPSGTVFASGGGARSTVWRQIMSDILGCAQSYYPSADEALADAFLACLASGHVTELGVFNESWLGTPDESQPSAEARDVYEESYALYRQVYDALLDIYGDSPLDDQCSRGDL